MVRKKTPIKKKKQARTQVKAVRRLVAPDPIDEIAPQVKEWADRILELRALTPVLADAKKVAAETESRMRVLQQELGDLLNGLLPGMPAEKVPPGRFADGTIDFDNLPPVVSGTGGSLPTEGTPEAPEANQGLAGMDGWPSEEPLNGLPSAEAYDTPLRDRDDLSAKTVHSCNGAGIMSVGKVVEWWAAKRPFSSIAGVGPAEDRELRALVGPFLSLVPKIRANLGMS